jgi:hypothetical protein
MTSLAQGRTNIALALALPAAGLLYLTSGVSLTMNASTVGVTVGLGALWLAAVVTLNTIRHRRQDSAARSLSDVAEHLVLPRAVTPAYGVDITRPVKPWRWTSVLPSNCSRSLGVCRL